MTTHSKIFILFIAAFCGWLTSGDPQPAISQPTATFTLVDTLQWEQPRFSELREERHRMVKQSLEQNGITDTKTLNAMKNVPRHLFVPERYQEHAYLNRPLPIDQGQTISQPYIVAYMTQMMNVQTGEKVLEIGTGSGYQAAVLSELTPYIYTIEIVEELGRQAQSRFEELGYHTINTKIGDGYKGWPEHAPFDAIILTAAPEEIPDPLIEQLATGGVLVAPVGKRNTTQFLVKITKSEDGSIHKNRNLPVRFVPMTGEAEKINDGS